MCYDIAVMTKRRLDYAKRRVEDPDSIKELEEEFEKQFPNFPKLYHASGFTHPTLPCFTDAEPLRPQALRWGLIPNWVKNAKDAALIANKTLNARSETMFDKTSFRESANKKRCLVYADHFYEHHHKAGKSFPYLIKLKSNEPMIMAGLWSEWTDKETGEVFKSVSIVTTKANKLMAEIHNNPKIQGPRMPLLLPKELQDNWLKPIEDTLDVEFIQELAQPYDSTEMEAYTVGKLRGKQAVGNTPEIIKSVNYPELSQESLF